MRKNLDLIKLGAHGGLGYYFIKFCNEEVLDQRFKVLRGGVCVSSSSSRISSSF